MSRKNRSDVKEKETVIDNLEHLLGTMATEGVIKEKYNKEKDEHEYSLTMKGELQGLKLLENDDGVLYFWKLMMDMLKDSIENPYERFLKCAEMLRDEMSINLLRVIERNEDKIQGFRIKTKGKEYEEMVRVFDPIGVYHEPRE